MCVCVCVDGDKIKLAKTIFARVYAENGGTVKLEDMKIAFQMEGFTSKKAIERIKEQLEFRQMEVNEKGYIVTK